MEKFQLIFLISCFVSISSANYVGPFLVWGGKNLDALKVPTLEAIDVPRLHHEFSKADRIIIYTRNELTDLDTSNYPQLSKLIEKEEFLYLPQSTLSLQSDIFKLEEPSTHLDDSEIIEDFERNRATYKDVIGILAVSNDPARNKIKREAKQSDEPKNVTYTPPSYFYAVPGKVLFYSEYVPIFNDYDNNITYQLLEKNLTVKAGSKIVDGKYLVELEVEFAVRNIESKTFNIWLGFNFMVSDKNWVMTHINYKNEDKIVNLTANQHPSAPKYKSFGCKQTFNFINHYNHNVSLVLQNIQVQPYPRVRYDYYNYYESTSFDEALDCNKNLLTPGIASGLFVSFICFVILIIALSTLMNVKTK